LKNGLLGAVGGVAGYKIKPANGRSGFPQ